MAITFASDVEKRIPRLHIVPVCLACGNRRVFLVKDGTDVVHLSGEMTAALPDLRDVICGRCRARHSTILDYEE